MSQAWKLGYDIDQYVHVQSLKLFKLFGGDVCGCMGKSA